MIRNIFMTSLLVLGSLAIVTSVGANSTKEIRTVFNKKYNDFREKFDIRTASSQELADQAKEVYELGKRVYEKDEESLAALGEFYVMAMDNQFNLSDYEEVIENSTRIYKHHNNPQAIELYIEQARFLMNRNKDNKGFKRCRQAINLAEELLSAEKFAGVRMVIGRLYYKHSKGEKNRYKDSRRLFEDAAAYFAGKDHRKYADASFWLGKSLLALRKSEKAIEQFNLATDIFSTVEDARRMERISRTFLVQALMQDGQEELASKQCLEVGKISSWDENSEIEPLYLVQPMYPMSAARSRKSGAVKFSFDVNLDGEAENIKIIESEGGEVFVKAATAALKKWRFAPKYENGKPVVAQATYTMQFKVAKRS